MSNKTKILLIAGLAVVLIGGMVIKGSEKISYQKEEKAYIVEVDQMVDDLEAEMVKIEADVVSGNLTPEGALAARTVIVNKINSIKEAVKVSEGVVLSPAMRASLNEALGRLSNVLETYRDSLVKVETLVIKAKGSKSKEKGVQNIELENALLDLVDEVIDFIDVVADEEYVGGDEIVDEEVNSDEESSEEVIEVIEDEEDQSEHISNGTDSGTESVPPESEGETESPGQTTQEGMGEATDPEETI